MQTNSNASIDHKDLLSPDDLEAMGIGAKSTTSKWRLYGSGPPYLKLGSRVAYRRCDVEEWLESRKRRSTSEAA